VRLLILFLLASLTTAAQNAMPAIGLWREHLPYQNMIDVTASSNKVYAATPYSLFSVDLSTNEIERISKVAGLNETGISTIKYDPLSDKLFVAYTNSNIDVIDTKGIYNIPDIKRRNISGDKSIYHIYPAGKYAYLSTGIGVIVVDAERFEIKDSWLIGNGGSYVKTNMFTKDNSFFYAATDQGLKRTSVNSSNPADFQQWQNLSAANGLPSAAAKGVVNVQNKIIALANDSLFVLNGNNWNLFYGDGWKVISINTTENKITLCQSLPNGNSKVTVLNADGSVARVFQQPNVIAAPRNAIVQNGTYWIADLYGGLSHWTNTTSEIYKPNSPFDIALGDMTTYNNVVYATAGAVNESWNYQYNRGGIFQLKDGNWSAFNQYRFPVLDTLMDFITVAVDPRDETVWAGSYGGGLLHIKDNNQLSIYKQNSPIGPTIGDPTSYRVAGLAFDGDNNLWVANYGAMNELHVLKENGTWKSFAAPFTLNENAAAQIIIDDANQKWIISPKGNGVIVFNHGNDIDNINDDRWKLYRFGRGNGNLPSNDVRSIAKDKSGFIWIGTDDGIGVIQCPESAFNGCEAVLPVAQQGGFANYLFKGEVVQTIAVDGADRKWIGTRNGVWLISPDGDKVIYHFTENNSPLLTNDVRHITINGMNGEVFFATTKGLISFRSTATEGGETHENVSIFPNPVPAGFTGTIGIKGLAANSFVKITELNGRLVYQTKALGGQAIWNGTDYTGRKIASGVYLLLVTDEGKQERTAGKIVFISQ
jgi:ligand-binding sensor domain-containing protein